MTNTPPKSTGRRASLQDQVKPILFPRAADPGAISDETIAKAVTGLVGLVNDPLDMMLVAFDRRTKQYTLFNVMPGTVMNGQQTRDLLLGAISFVTKQETLEEVKAMAEQSKAEADAQAALEALPEGTHALPEAPVTSPRPAKRGRK